MAHVEQMMDENDNLLYIELVNGVQKGLTTVAEGNIPAYILVED